MANPLLIINQPRDVDLGQDGTIRLGIRRPERAFHRRL